jgi:hypothetical protein
MDVGCDSFSHSITTNVEMIWKSCERGGRGLTYGTIWKSAFRYSENIMRILVKKMPQPRFEPGTYIQVKAFAA